MSDVSYRERCTDCGEWKWRSSFRAQVPGICNQCRAWRKEAEKWRVREVAALRRIENAQKRLAMVREQRRSIEWRRVRVHLLRQSA